MILEKPRYFRQVVESELEKFIAHQKENIPADECLCIDLHCHDHNSSQPDEKLGRLLGVAETWLPTEKLLKILEDNGTTAVTITNHNNAKSCWAMLDKGLDVLVGAEFTCRVPDFKIDVHVLTYGFTPEQEAKLKRRSANIIRFLEYAAENDIVTTLAHPFYFYVQSPAPVPLEFFDLMSILFERFEGINGQRDSWQNLLTAEWITSLTPEHIDRIAKKFGLSAAAFCRDPYRKRLTGGSDDHMGIFAGNTGTRIHVPDLAEKLKTAAKSELVLEGLKNGSLAPYGRYTEDNKMAVSLLDFFCQVFIHMKDPGLIRMILHKGKKEEKINAFLIANGVFELRRHRYTSKFLMAFHNALHGKSPGFWTRQMASKNARKMLDVVEQIAATRRKNPSQMEYQLNRSLNTLYHAVSKLLMSRLDTTIKEMMTGQDTEKISLREILARFEIPSYVRHLGMGDRGVEPKPDEHMTVLNVGKVADNLSFPLLASVVLAGTYYASSRVMTRQRDLLYRFADRLGKHQHPKRILWLSDTFQDTNGISVSLGSYLKEIQERDLPIDLLVCNNELTSEDHLIVTKPVAEFVLPIYKDQTFRVPDLLAIQKIFNGGGYDRIMCSTELLMGAVALYLKSAFHVPAYFFVHTDWVEFSQKTLKFEKFALKRLRRIARGFYQSFDKLFVLNEDHRLWLTGQKMQIPADHVHTIKHWVGPQFTRRDTPKSQVFPGVSDKEKVLLYVGRVSEEKGVFDFPFIYNRVKSKCPHIAFVIIGRGPAKEKLVEQFPEAKYIDWIEQDQLPEVYSAADALVFPSTFDTFGRVVLEAISCGLPAAAYNMKGPKDIIEDGVCGILAENKTDLANRLTNLLVDSGQQKAFRASALKRAKLFQKERIIAQFLADTEMASIVNNDRILKRGNSDRGRAGGSPFIKELLEIVNS